MFCRESVTEAMRLLPQISDVGTQLAFVHMSTEDKAFEFFSEYGAQGLPRISDPEMELYEAFKIGKGSRMQIASRQVLAGALRAYKAGHRQGKTEGDAAQMPGAFLLHRGVVLRSFYHDTAADQPDYLELARVPTESPK